MTTFKLIIPVWLVVLGFALYPAISFAIVDVAENVELEGFVKAQNILRTPKFADAELIMQRNTAQIEGKYYFLKEGVAFNRFSTGSLEEATFSFIGRAV